MSHNYVLDDNKNPVPEPDLLTWAKRFQEDTETGKRIVAQTKISNEVEVSTVFLGSDHQFGDGPPLLFETLVFGGECDGDMWRYSTWKEAEISHKEVVERLSKHVIKSCAPGP